jgi:hypothetical protein
MQPDLVPSLETHGISQAVVAGLHSVTGHLQMLAHIMMDVMQPIHEVHHVMVVDCSLSEGAPNNGSQGRCSSPQTPCWQASFPWSCGLMLCRPAGKEATPHPDHFGALKQPSSTVFTYHSSMPSEEGWSVSFIFPGPAGVE